MTPVFTRSWSDAFGSAYATLEGGTGSEVILIAARPEAAQDGLALLKTLPAFKGRIVLCAFTTMHTAPLLSALRQTEPSAVIALEEIDGIADRGAATTLESGEFIAATGLEYIESGECVAWQSSLSVLNSLEIPSLASSLAAAQGLRVLACAVSQLTAALEIVRSSHRA